MNREINHGKNTELTNQIKSLLKIGLDDLFKDVTVPNKDKNKPPVRILKTEPDKERAMKEKMRRNHNQDLLIKLKMITGLRIIRGPLFCDSIMKKIHLAK